MSQPRSLKINGKSYPLRYYYTNDEGKLIAVLMNAYVLQGKHGDEWPVDAAGKPL